MMRNDFHQCKFFHAFSLGTYVLKFALIYNYFNIDTYFTWSFISIGDLASSTTKCCETILFQLLSLVNNNQGLTWTVCVCGGGGQTLFVGSLLIFENFHELYAK